MSLFTWTKPCPGCPFTASSIVSPARVKDIVDDCNAKDVHFTCHKDASGTMAAGTGDVMCKGYLDKVFKKTGAGNLTRILMRLGGIPERELPADKEREALESLMPYRDQAKAQREYEKRQALILRAAKKANAALIEFTSSKPTTKRKKR